MYNVRLVICVHTHTHGDLCGNKPELPVTLLSFFFLLETLGRYGHRQRQAVLLLPFALNDALASSNGGLLLALLLLALLKRGLGEQC
jgi:hypothetical protein